jgi:serine phosphatase RsbU (regulator of sigma subunit)
MVFDIYAGKMQNQTATSLLPLEEYLYRLAAAGMIPLDDLLHHTGNHLRRMYNLIQHSRYALNDANTNLARKTAELAAANQVLLKRTETLITLQDTLQMLAASNNLSDLAQRVCRKARDVCNADHAILYYFHLGNSPPEAEVLAVVGWDPRLQGHRLPAELLQGRGGERKIASEIGLPLGELPKGITAHTASILSGMRVPLVSQGQHLGAIILHSTRKSSFTPGEAALLDTFAHQAALAIQRAGLVDELRHRLQELQTAQAELVKKERLEHELELAKQLQQSILPRSFPSYPGFTISAANSPARQVGGDFYDVFRLDDEHFGLLIADVSDKGMPAALYMALTRSLILAEAHRSQSPKIVLENVHRLLLELGQTDMFVSVFYGIMDTPTRRLCYTRAGHERPFLVRGATIYPLLGNGTVLGILDLSDLNLEEQSIQLQSGDRLILFTDGILDTSNQQDEFFGIDRFKSLLVSLHHSPTDLVCQQVFAALEAYQSTSYQFDDQTLLVLDIEAVDHSS